MTNKLPQRNNYVECDIQHPPYVFQPGTTNQWDAKKTTLNIVILKH